MGPKKPDNSDKPVGSPIVAKGKIFINKHASPSKTKIGGQIISGKNRLYMEAFDGGILLGYFDNGSNFNTAAYNKPHITELQNNDELMEQLNINDIAYRRGVDGKTALPGRPNATWNWQTLVSIIGVENVHNKEFIEKEFVIPVLAFFNKFDDLTIEYTFTRKTCFIANNTCRPARKISTALLDEKILHLMLAAYGDSAGHIDLGTLAEVDEIVEMYWEDKEYGKGVMRMAHAAHMF